MATTGVILGHFMRVKMGPTSTVAAIYAATECSIDVTTDTTEVNHKDNYSIGWKESKAAVNSWTAETSGLYFMDQTVTADDLIAHQIAKTELFFEFTTGVSGDTKYSGKCILTSSKLNAPNGDLSTYTASFLGTGPLTPTTVA